MDRDDDDKLDLSSAKSTLGSYKPFRPLSSSVEVEFGAVTDPGRRRTTSDDHYLIVRLGRHQETIASSLPEGAVPDRFDEQAYGMVVADGMGPDGPEIASRHALATLAQLVLHFGKWNVRVNERTAWEIVQRAERFYRRVGEEVTEASQQHPALSGMSTTLIDLDFGPDGSLYVLQHTSPLVPQPPNPFAGPGVVIRIAPDGTRTTVEIPGLIRPTSLLVDWDGTIYVTNNGVTVGAGQVWRIEH